MPDEAVRRVGTAYTRSCLTCVIERVIIAENKSSCVYINRVIYVTIAEIRCAEKAWNISVIGKNMITEAVRFTGKNSAVFRVNDGAVGIDSVLNLFTKISNLCKKIRIFNIHLGENLINISENNSGKHI